MYIVNTANITKVLLKIFFTKESIVTKLNHILHLKQFTVNEKIPKCSKFTLFCLFTLT